MSRVRLWLPVIGWMGVIFFLSGRESTRVSDVQLINVLFFKTLHVIEYGILFLLTKRAMRSPFAAFLFTVAYAVTDELHQRFVPTREGRLRDVIIDATGAGLAWIFVHRLLPKAPMKLRALAKKWEIT